MSRPLWTSLWPALAACLAGTGIVRGDVVAARGKPPLVNTQVLRIRNGQLVCRGDGGQEAVFALDQVDYLQITGWQMFDVAERQRRAEEWHRAAVSYEKVLAELQAGPQVPVGSGEALDRTLLVKCRLIAACDAQARFDRAVELYLEVLERMPVVVDTLRPRQYPETGSALLEAAARHVDAFVARHREDEVSRSLLKWRAGWPVRETWTSQPAGSQPAALPADSRLRNDIAVVAGFLQSGGSPADALSRIAGLQKTAAGPLRADLYYWQGRALESMPPVATSPASTQPAGNAALSRAGLAYMRVVVHFPGHPLAAECLYRSAGLCRRSGQQARAADLLSELIAVYPQAKGPDGRLWADRAREELK
jgi:hypothetical protein